VLAALLLLAAMLAHQIAIGTPLGPDEAIYATGGREVVEGTPASAYALYRPVGMKALAAVGLAFDFSEWAVRVPVLLCSLGFLIAFRALGRRAFGPWPAAWAAAAMVTSFAIQRRGAEILSDVPALLLLILVLLVLVRELGRDGGRPGLAFVAVAPLAAAAFYLRYGVSTSLVGIALAAAMVWWRPIVSGRSVVLATAALLALLLVPHVLHSLEETGSVLGILRVSGDAAHRAYLGQGLVQFPLALVMEGGPVLLALLVIGAVAGARCVIRLRRERRHSQPTFEDRATAFLWVASVFQILVTGLLVHAEFRYYFFGVSGLVLIGCAAACKWAASRNARRLGISAAAAVLVVAVATHGFNVYRYKRLGEIRAVIVAAAEKIRAAAAEETCWVAASRTAQIGWYSGCTAQPIKTPPDQLGTGRRFLVVFKSDGGRGRAARKRWRRPMLVGRAVSTFDRSGDAAIYELR
jgi:4-amino-4-deoxy-L-arabinose transferase-like glycosyltransferase